MGEVSFDGMAKQRLKGIDGGAGSGRPPHNGNMEARVIRLEDFAQKAEARFDGIDKRLDGIDVRLNGIDVRLAGIDAKLDTFATKADLHEMGGSMIKWMVGTAVGLGVAAITVMTFVLNNAAPKAAAAAMPPAIIVNVPAAAPPALPAKP